MRIELAHALRNKKYISSEVAFPKVYQIRICLDEYNCYVDQYGSVL
jgi:hypothetical protein